MGRGVGFVSRALCGAFVALVPGVVAVHPTIFDGFIAPEVVGEVPAAEYAGAVGAPLWLVAPPFLLLLLLQRLLWPLLLFFLLF